MIDGFEARLVNLLADRLAGTTDVVSIDRMRDGLTQPTAAGPRLLIITAWDADAASRCTVIGAPVSACSDIAEQLPGLDAWTINTCLAQALAWANNIGRENEANS